MSHRAEVEPANRTELAYELLLKKIMTGHWYPGATLSTYALAEELEISRTPILEALKRLQAEGIVEIIPQIGCRVVQPTARDVAEVFTVRAVLEGLAAETAAVRISDKELKALWDLYWQSETAAESGESERYDSLNRQFHLSIVNASGMRKLEETMSGIWLLVRHQLSSIPFIAGRIERSMSEHLAILAALSSRDAESARRASEQHVRRCSQDFSSFLASREAALTGAD